MRRHLIVLAALLSLFSPAAQAANSAVSALTAASAFGGTELLYIVQGAADRKGTPAQMATYTYGLMTGDCTVTASAIVCTKTNGVAFGTFATASATTATAALNLFSSSLQGLVPASGGGTANFLRADGTFAAPPGGSGAVSSVTGGVGITVSPTTGAVVVSSTVTQRNNTATTDTLLSTDSGAVITESNASPVAVGIAVASTTGFTSGNYWTVKNKGAGLVTITPTTSQIDGASSLALTQYQSVDIYSDGTNYWTLPGRATGGGTTNTIASGTAALGTSAIASAACATVVTSTATGVATTDTVTASFNADPTAVTGYIPLTTGALTIFAYPTSGNVNFKVCNLTSSSVTPGAITLNWRVVR